MTTTNPTNALPPAQQPPPGPSAAALSTARSIAKSVMGAPDGMPLAPPRARALDEDACAAITALSSSARIFWLCW